MENSVKQRLVNFLKYKRLSQKKFEETVGLSNGYVNNIRQSITPNKLQQIALHFPELNKGWLLTGEGEMLNGSDVSLVEAQGDHVEEEVHATPNGTTFYQTDNGKIFMDVPVVPIAALGSPEDEWSTIQQQEPCEKMRFDVDGVHHGNYWVFKVEGSSMDDGTYNGFRQGDTVLVRELPRDEWAPHLRFNDWPFWVVVFDNNVRLKQIVAQDTEAGTITLHSLNPSPEYTDFTLPLSRITHLFNVIRNYPRPNFYKK